MIQPKSISFTSDSKWPVTSKSPISWPVLHVHSQLVEGVVVNVGQRPDEDVPQPELPVKVPEAHLVVLPAPHEVLVRLHVVPDLEHHPASTLGLEVAVHFPRSLG